MSCDNDLNSRLPYLSEDRSRTAQPSPFIAEIQVVGLVDVGKIALALFKIDQFNPHRNSPQRRTADLGAMSAKGHYSDGRRSVNAGDE
jgi:hypothetical protein